ncbi:MAG: zinc-ribbon domain-containing protein [Oscillospiraceae bacterium]
MFCEYCGKQIDDNAKFCEFCGKTTEEDVTADAVSEPPEIKTENIGRGRILFVLEMLLNVIVAACPFIKMFEITVIRRFQFSFVGMIDTVNTALDVGRTLGINIKFPKTGNFGFWITLILIGAAAAMAAGYVFLVLSIISLGKRQKFSSSRKKSAVSLGCFLGSFALDYLAIFLINSKISDTIFLKFTLFGANVWFYIFAAAAVVGIVLAWCYKRRARL